MLVLDAIIEDPAGATRRHHRDPTTGRWVTRRHPHTASPWPANYGFIPGTPNPADGDDLDVLVLASDPLPTGSRVCVRVVGLLHRPDGDHKVLAVRDGDPLYAGVADLTSVPDADIARITAWFRDWTEPGTWEDHAAAEGLIAACRAAGAQSPGHTGSG